MTTLAMGPAMAIQNSALGLGGSSADDQGLREGMVINQVGDNDIDTAEQFEAAVSAKEAANGVRVRVTDSSGGARFVFLSPAK